MKYLLTVIIIIALIFSFICIKESYSAPDPSLIMMETDDEIDDWMSVAVRNDMDHPTSYEGEFGHRSCVPNENMSMVDIKSVSYTSDARFLNSTTWLAKPFLVKPNVSNALVYSMSVFPADNYIHNAVYTIAISWDPLHHWEQTIYRHSISNSTMTVDGPNEISHFYGNSTNYKDQALEGYVKVSVSKDKIPFPKKFYVVTSALAYDKKCVGIDTGQIIDTFPRIMNKLYDISPLVMRAGEEKIVQIGINSSLNLNPTVSFTPNIAFAINESKGISTQILDQNQSLDSRGTAFTRLKINIPHESPPRTYILPIHLNITFPASVFYPVYFNDIQTQSTLMLEAHDVQYLYLVVNPEYSFGDWWSDTWKTYGGLISLVLAGFFAGLGAMIPSFIKRKKKQVNST